jgi:hypothetical protein
MYVNSKTIYPPFLDRNSQYELGMILSLNCKLSPLSILSHRLFDSFEFLVLLKQHFVPWVSIRMEQHFAPQVLIMM